MKGCVSKRGKNNYCIIIELGKDSEGKRKRKYYYGYKKKKDAEKDLVIKLHEMETNNFINPENITLSEYLKKWFEDYVKQNLQLTTIEGYKTNIYKHIIPELGSIKLQKLLPVQIQSFYDNKLKSGLSPTTIIYIHRNLRNALERALRLRLINNNPANFAQLPRKTKFKASYLKAEQVKELINSFQKSEIYIPVLLGVMLGLRRGEVLGLKWNDINFSQKLINVSRSLVHTTEGLNLVSPKTETSSRILLISDFLISELKEYKKNQESNKNLLGKAYKNNNLVCCKPDGDYYNPKSFSHKFARDLNKFKLPHIRFHDLRHTNATLMLEKNISPKIASERLGHSRISVTMDIYSHMFKEMQQDAVNKLDELILDKKE